MLNGPTVVLPPHLVPELCAASDSELDFRRAVIIDGLQADYLFPSTAHNPFHATVIRRQLTHSMVRSQATSIMKEVRRAVDSQWMYPPQSIENRAKSKAEIGEASMAEDNPWVTVNVYDTIVAILTQITMRVFVGEPLCQDQAFIRTAVGLFANVRLAAGLLNLLPTILRG